jgi:Transglutaminase-like superfamily
MTPLFKFVRLPFSDKSLLVRAWIVLIWCTLRVRLLPHPENRSWIFQEDPLMPAPPETEAEKIAWSVRVSSRYVPGCLCLPQALAGRILLAARGYRSKLRIVVRKEDSKFEAHAWLESEGRVWVGDFAEHQRSEQPSWAILR